jgi:FtsP/CotA-like multicopper oxidase with cupredoxin domain
MKKILLTCLFIIVAKITFSATIFDTIYINKAPYTIGSFTFQACVFNDSSNFKLENAIIELNEGDNLQLHVINNDTLEHTFTIDGLVDNTNLIMPNGTNDFTINFTNKGAYRFYSDKFYGKHLGASSIIMYGYQNYPKYYWNMFEQSDTLSQDIANLQVNTIPFTYQPDIFTINLKVHPDLENDLHAKINQQVGDTIYITVLNSGKMFHTLHFHGYHVEIVEASINTKYNGWTKDSFGILESEILLLRLVPDQAGTYPVHEHNLINVTTNGVYPGGMLNLINIQP